MLLTKLSRSCTKSFRDYPKLPPSAPPRKDLFRFVHILSEFDLSNVLLFDWIGLVWFSSVEFWVLVSVVMNFILVCCLNGLIN